MRSCTPQKRAQKSRGNGKAERACQKSRLHPCSFSVLIRKFNPERNQCRHPHPIAAPRATASAKQCPHDGSAGKPEHKRQQPQQLFAQPDLTADRTSPAHTTVARRSDGIKRRESHGKKNRQAKQCLQNTLVRFHTGASSFSLICARFSGYADAFSGLHGTCIVSIVAHFSGFVNTQAVRKPTFAKKRRRPQTRTPTHRQADSLLNHNPVGGLELFLIDLGQNHGQNACLIFCLDLLGSDVPDIEAP